MEPRHRLFAHYSQYIWSKSLHQPSGEHGSSLISCPQKKKHIMFISQLLSVNNITYISLFSSFMCTPSFYAFPCPLRDALIYCREGHCVVAQGEVNRFNGLITILKPPPLTCFKIAV